MKIAISLASKGFMYSFPNPSVGCVIVESSSNYKNEKIVGFGCTQKTGRPHAEANAIEKINFNKKKKYICYTTLEPCCHVGRDQSCVDKIISSQIDEVVISFMDPDKRMNGKGIDLLKKNNIIVRKGILKNESIKLYEGYFLNKIKLRPKIILKLAVSLDGKISYGNKNKKWISNKNCRRYVHYERARNDAILVGSNTLREDNPKLDCRIMGLKDASPIKIIISKDLDFSENLKVFSKYSKRSLIFTSNGSKENILRFKNINADIFKLKLNDFKLKNILEKISELGVSNLIVEGGSKIFGSFIKSQLVDSIMIFRSGHFIGNKGLEAFDLENFNFSSKNLNLKLKNFFLIDDNHLEVYANQKTEEFFKKVIEHY